MIKVLKLFFFFLFQINIIINQITGVENPTADLLGVRFAGINQILDPWLYVLLRKALILKIVKYIHHKVCRRSKIDGAGRTLHSYENVPVDREQISLGPLEDLQIKVLCVTTDKHSCDHDHENESSDDSMSSLSNLISNLRQGDVRYVLTSEHQETAITNSSVRDQNDSEQRLSQSVRNSPVKRVRVRLKRNHSSPGFETTKSLKLRSNNETNDDSVITV
jgi:hypothetical protein